MSLEGSSWTDSSGRKTFACDEYFYDQVETVGMGKGFGLLI